MLAVFFAAQTGKFGEGRSRSCRRAQTSSSSSSFDEGPANRSQRMSNGMLRPCRTQGCEDDAEGEIDDHAALREGRHWAGDREREGGGKASTPRIPAHRPERDLAENLKGLEGTCEAIQAPAIPTAGGGRRQCR